MLTKKCNGCSKLRGRRVKHPLYYFHRNVTRPDGLADECQFIAQKRKREIYQRFNGLTGVATL